jgi:hypothetical protein
VEVMSTNGHHGGGKVGVRDTTRLQELRRKSLRHTSAAIDALTSKTPPSCAGSHRIDTVGGKMKTPQTQSIDGRPTSNRLTVATSMHTLPEMVLTSMRLDSRPLVSDTATTSWNEINSYHSNHSNNKNQPGRCTRFAAAASRTSSSATQDGYQSAMQYGHTVRLPQPSKQM